MVGQSRQAPIRMCLQLRPDSSLIGSYYYRPTYGLLRLHGRLHRDGTFELVEQAGDATVTGQFTGVFAADGSRASGQWTTPKQKNAYSFRLVRNGANSYWDYIHQNRRLPEYRQLRRAILAGRAVRSVDVSSQGISQLSAHLTRCTGVVSMNLLNNQFRTFPAVLSRLLTLNELSLSSNGLRHLGPEIGRLRNLKILYLNFNQLTALPPEMGALVNLLYLDLSSNHLTSLPEEIKYLTNLQEMHAEQNRFSPQEKWRIRQLLPYCKIYF